MAIQANLSQSKEPRQGHIFNQQLGQGFQCRGQEQDITVSKGLFNKNYSNPAW